MDFVDEIDQETIESVLEMYPIERQLFERLAVSYICQKENKLKRKYLDELNSLYSYENIRYLEDGYINDEEKEEEKDEEKEEERKKYVFKPHTKQELVQAIKDVETKLSNRDSLDESLIQLAEKYGNIEDWDVSEITDMSNVFEGSNLDINLNNWDTSNVTTMKGMFKGTKNFNNGGKPLTFNTENVSDMSQMFYKSENFNQSLNGLNMSNVVNVKNMFNLALKYNNGDEPLTWDISHINIDNTPGLFENAKSFDNGGKDFERKQFSDSLTNSQFTFKLLLKGTLYRDKERKIYSKNSR